MSKFLLSRRDFMKGMGGAAMGLTAIPSLMSRQLLAATTPKKRLIVFFSPDGQREEIWFPQNLPSLTTIAPNVATCPLASIPPLNGGAFSTVFSKEFNPYLGKMNVLRGIDSMQYGTLGHDPGFPLTGYTRTTIPTTEYPTVVPTIDQVIAKNIYATPPVFPSLGLLCKSFQQPYAGTISFANVGGSVVGVNPLYDPAAAFDYIFKSITPTPGKGYLYDDKISVVNNLMSQYKNLLGNSRLSSADNLMIHQHMSMLSDLENRIQAQKSLTGCNPPSKPSPALFTDADTPAEMASLLKLLAAAVKCNLSEVFTFSLSVDTDAKDYSWIPGLSLANIGVNEHGCSHFGDSLTSAAASMTGFGSVKNWLALQILYFLTLLDVVEDTSTGATYLDNSLIVYLNSAGMNKGGVHNKWSLPIATWGSLGGVVNTGQYIDYTTNKYLQTLLKGSTVTLNHYLGTPYNIFLETILLAFGLTPAQYVQPYNTAQGWQGYGDYTNFNSQYTVTYGQPLPGILKS